MSHKKTPSRRGEDKIMDIGRVSVPLELKFSGGSVTGFFEGYGAVFGNIDRGGDVIDPGAFTKSLNHMSEIGVDSVPMYYNHDRTGGAIGVWTEMVEDKRGLQVKGRLIGLDTDQGKMNLARLREGAIKGLSIGYRVPPGGSRVEEVKGKRCRRLKQIDLSEVSLVDDPMNPLARVNFQKNMGDTSAGEIKTVRQFESFLRESLGWSRAKACAVAERGFKVVQTEEAKEVISGVSKLETFIKSLSQK